MYYFMDSGPTFTGRVSLNAGVIVLGHVSRISCVVPEIFAIKVGSCVKLAQILHVFGSKNFLVEGPRIFEHELSTGADSDHVVKFRGDRPRELGDPLADLKSSRLKQKASRNYRSGRSNKKSKLSLR